MRFSNFLLITTLVILLTGCSDNDRVPSRNYNIDTTALTFSERVDRQMNSMLTGTSATAILVAVAQDDEIIYEQAYGFQDADKTIPLTTDALMRTASIVKPITAAAIKTLASAGVLALSDYVFCSGENQPCWLPENLLSDTSDARTNRITIRHLIEHTGGWYSDVSGNIIDKEVEIRDSLGLSRPPNKEDIVRYVMKRPLDYNPGAPQDNHVSYSNFGYLVLGMIIEQASQTSYTQYVQTAVMLPLGISELDFKAAESKLEDHDPREAAYISTAICPSIFDVDAEAPCYQEGAEAKNWVAAGLSLATARAMALFAQAYKIPKFPFASTRESGDPLLPGATFDGYHNGGLAGLRTILRQFPSGISYAVFVNADIDLDSYLFTLDTMMKSATAY